MKDEGVYDIGFIFGPSTKSLIQPAASRSRYIGRFVDAESKFTAEQTEEPEHASESDCADYDDCANPPICNATVDDY